MRLFGNLSDARVELEKTRFIYSPGVTHMTFQVVEIFSGKSEADGAGKWMPEDVRSPARLRLYRATVSEHFVLDPKDRRTPVSL